MKILVLGEKIMQIPQKITKIMELAGEKGTRPFDRLERGKSLLKGKQAVEAISEKELGLAKDATAFLQSALYIYFDCFEEAHQIAQDNEGVTGNWLHALLHRREPDAGNSKYWYHRVNAPAKVYKEIGRKVLERLGKTPPAELASLVESISKSDNWEPEVFVDLCNKMRKKDSSSPAYQALAEIQEIEWMGLLEFILESA